MAKNGAKFKADKIIKKLPIFRLIYTGKYG